MSVFQFTRVWLRLNRADRKKAWEIIDKKTFVMALECDYAYKNLYNDVLCFYKNKQFQALKYDIKKNLRSLLKRR